MDAKTQNKDDLQMAWDRNPDLKIEAHDYAEDLVKDIIGYEDE